MNKYAELATRHWKTTDPDRYAAIEDPQTYFTQLGEAVETQVQELTDRLAGPDQPGEEYLQKVGRLNMARLQAEEAILTELVWIAPPARQEQLDEEEIETYGREEFLAQMRAIRAEPDEHETPTD